MRFDVRDRAYKKHLKEEDRIWSGAAKKQLRDHDPDYRYYRRSLPYLIYRSKYLRRLLAKIKPGQKVLDLGCYNGWFSLELARRGATVDAHDAASGAIKIARSYYKKVQAKEKLKGSVNYHVTDLNDAKFAKGKYDVVVVRNVLHHIGNVDELIEEVDQALKPRGLVLCDDSLRCGKLQAMAIGVLLMLLPTDIPYTQKLQRVFNPKKGGVLKRTQELTEAKGASPFEGVSGEESVAVLRRKFRVTEYETFAAFIGVIAPRLKLPMRLKVSVLKALNLVDHVLIEAGVVTGSVYYLEAKKK